MSEVPLYLVDPWWTRARMVDIGLPGRGNSSSHGARPVHKNHLDDRTSKLSRTKSLSGGSAGGNSVRLRGQARSSGLGRHHSQFPHRPLPRGRAQSGFNSHPCTLHHTPCTLHPTPRTPHPAPYTLHPTPYTQHPEPHIMHPTPFTLTPTPYTLGGSGVCYLRAPE